ncbi:MAG TPA: ABC transporter substrate-binding protein [Albitalea sp.]|uniref:MlaC/ttg2D family ABC transporter substrate-binding protein n=1 Tax=Piscinibacter sp. TaxID=1903157 RepID=UPI002ED366E7
MNRTLKLLLALATSVAIDAWAAPTSSADAVISTMTQQVLAKSSAASDPAQFRALIESTILPNVDFRVMTARTVGPKWRGATDEQKRRLMAGFEALLIKTYAGALSQAGGAKYRLRQTLLLDATTAEVRSDVTVPGGRDPVTLNYRLELQGDQWKIIDMSVLGIWLVPTYQTQFAQVMERTGGLDGLVASLEERTKAR